MKSDQMTSQKDFQIRHPNLSFGFINNNYDLHLKVIKTGTNSL